MEDAIALARELASDRPLPEALAAYQDERMTEALRLQNAARNSMEWFEHVRRYISMDPEQFTYSLLTRSQRVSHENLRLRDPEYLGGVERWFAGKTPAPPAAAEAGASSTPPPMFTPFTLRGMTVVNRVVVAPMDMYSAVDGTPSDFHLVHLGTRALGGAGLVITEMACVAPEARITLGCTGMYTPEHLAAWRRIVDFVHAESAAKICLQLGHSGSKGSTRLPWDGGELEPESEGWEVMGPSAVRYAPSLGVPRPMDRADMDRVRDEFVAAARMGIDAGFDMLELHCAHGYLLSSFITPLSNQRTDEYGGSLENRLRYPVEVFRAMRAAWPAERPMSVRISATDWVEGGVTGDDAVADREGIHRRGRGHHPRLDRADVHRGEAGLRPDVPDAIQRSDSQRGAHSDHRRRQHHRGRPGQRHHRRGPRGSVRAGAAAPGRSVLDAARGGRARLHARSSGRGSTYTGRRQLERQLAEKGILAMNDRVHTGLAGQHAVVTGGGRGIGAAIAGALAARGVHVTVMGRTASAVSEMAQVARGQFQDARARRRRATSRIRTM